MLLYALVSLGLFAYAVVDLATTPRTAVRTLPKALWFLVVLPPVFGPVAWLLAGRPRKADRTAPAARPPARPVAPDDDEDFLRDLRRRGRDPRDDAA
jgi:hypothetical protein